MKFLIYYFFLLNLILPVHMLSQAEICAGAGFGLGGSKLNFSGIAQTAESNSSLNQKIIQTGLIIKLNNYLELGFQYLNLQYSWEFSGNQELSLSNGDYVKWNANSEVAIRGFSADIRLEFPFKNNHWGHWLVNAGYIEGNYLTDNNSILNANYMNQIVLSQKIPDEKYRSVTLEAGFGFDLTKWLEINFKGGYNYSFNPVYECTYQVLSNNNTQIEHISSTGSGWFFGSSVCCPVYRFKKHEKKPEKFVPQYNNKDEITSIDNRDIVELHSITVRNDNLEIQLWDYGKEDGDKISLFLNNNIILKKYTLAGKRKTLNINLVPGLNKLIVYAHNLGKDPPNTASVTITENGKKHVMSLQSTLGECGSISIYYEPYK